jgi:hypothetical protein
MNFIILFGGRPPNPRGLSHIGPKHDVTKAKGRKKYGPHASDILPVLGSLPSVALSSGKDGDKISGKKSLCKKIIINKGVRANWKREF